MWISLSTDFGRENLGYCETIKTSWFKLSQLQLKYLNILNVNKIGKLKSNSVLVLEPLHPQPLTHQKHNSQSLFTCLLGFLHIH